MVACESREMGHALAMCGIVGFLRPGLSEDRSRSIVSAMADTLSHRGPDDSDTWVDSTGGIAFGHRRLSIIDLSPDGRQPIRLAGGRYVMVYNGEVYNFAELREQLRALGRTFKGGSDSEVVLASIEVWGVEDALQRLVGMFAFALWDTRDRELILCRDRLGIKPLYWGQFGNLFLFGSELKALRACPDWQAEIDDDSLNEYFRWNYVPSPKSIYRGVAKLKPGTVLRYRAGQQPEISTYWNMRDVAVGGLRRREPLDDAQAISEMDALIGDAVECRMVSDVPLGAMLSGGIDSSLITALMQSRSSRPVKTYSIGFHEGDYNEAVYAAKIARHLGTEHTELYVAPDHALEVIPKLPDIYDEPFADSSQIPTYLISELTRREVTVALSGDGGDELFAGYTRYKWANMVANRFGSVPASARNAAAGMIDAFPSAIWEMGAKILPISVRPKMPARKARMLSVYLRERDADAIYCRQHTHWTDAPTNTTSGNDSRSILYDRSVKRDLPNFIERMQFLDSVTYLPDDILTKVDRASMAVGLETRVPLLDHRVVEAAWRLGPSAKIRDGQSKWLLRRVLDKYVPVTLIDRPKMGFSIPLGAWLRGPLREWAEDLLSVPALEDGGYLDSVVIRNVWKQFLTGHDDTRELIWGVLMFQAWRRRAL